MGCFNTPVPYPFLLKVAWILFPACNNTKGITQLDKGQGSWLNIQWKPRNQELSTRQFSSKKQTLEMNPVIPCPWAQRRRQSYIWNKKIYPSLDTFQWTRFNLQRMEDCHWSFIHALILDIMFAGGGSRKGVPKFRKFTQTSSQTHPGQGHDWDSVLHADHSL